MVFVLYKSLFFIFLVSTSVRDTVLSIVEKCYKHNASGKLPADFVANLVNYEYTSNSPPLDLVIPQISDAGMFFPLVS